MSSVTTICREVPKQIGSFTRTSAMFWLASRATQVYYTLLKCHEKHRGPGVKTEAHWQLYSFVQKG